MKADEEKFRDQLNSILPPFEIRDLTMTSQLQMRCNLSYQYDTTTLFELPARKLYFNGKMADFCYCLDPRVVWKGYRKCRQVSLKEQLTLTFSFHQTQICSCKKTDGLEDISTGSPVRVLKQDKMVCAMVVAQR